jgi:hypothetical protein
MVKGRASLFVSAIVVSALACQPNLDDTVSIVTAPTVLAVQSIPAEAPPMGKVTYTALVAQGAGPDAGATRLVWDYCNARNPLSNLGPVSTVCVRPGNTALATIGAGLHASGSVPDVACSNFGPNAPPATDGGVAGQPVNPDSTGGYYQPVSVFESSDAGLGGVEDTVYFLRATTPTRTPRWPRSPPAARRS